MTYPLVDWETISTRSFSGNSSIEFGRHRENAARVRRVLQQGARESYWARHGKAKLGMLGRLWVSCTRVFRDCV